MNSTKTVIEKLNMEKYLKKLILHKPEDICDFDELEFDITIKKDKYDLVFIFVFNLEDYANTLKNVIEKKLIEKNGYLYIAYPKKNNPTYAEYIERDSMLAYIVSDEEGYVLQSDLKFSRMVSMNETFTVVGLKSTPKKLKKSASTSQCVDDYIENVEDIIKYLERNEKLLNLYNQLTPGYQKDWARYVYSAKRKETQEKRLFEMEIVLGEGYKTKDLYRRRGEK
ncbi:YdeI/OmpD-associated family protein [Psychrobacillus sp. NPDC058041]|uniref:YdeI/OmpD-associated family protein n=1 Tax=Psychrobacillus sp. NPDC058041 TaxID=3346310 RepID=UPI0036DCDDEC